MRPTVPCTYYSIDIEATGPVPGLFSMVSLGAVVVAPGEDENLLIGESFYAELKPVFAGSQPEANAIHGLDLERLKHDGLDPALAMRRLAEFVDRTCLRGTSPVFVGHVAVFDWMYVAWYFAWCGLENPFGYKGIDTKSLAMGALGLPWTDTSRETLVERLGLRPQAQDSLHRADADALHQAEILVALLERSRLSPGA
ncbi:MAG: 3'-5' exonuclease [Acidobacteriota bacterium]|nr:MAG: 3'-5' exonuclease [Acidobacteriota bacterium]